MPKRRIFVSFDHDDTDQVNGFLGLREIIDGFEFYNHKLDRRINSSDGNYVGRVIREEYITPSSVAVVLIGNRTAQSDWVKWEIAESRRQGKGRRAADNTLRCGWQHAESNPLAGAGAMIPKGCKRLGEVDFPIDELSRHAARKKSIRHRLPSATAWKATAP